MPCVDGLELISSEDPDTKIQIASVLRHHPGPIALRLPADAQILLEPGYLLLDLPAKSELQRGESIRVDTGCLVALEQSVTYNIEWAAGFKSPLFGGEGSLLTTLTGPGRVWLQSLPFSRFAGRMLASAVAAGFHREERLA